MSENVKETSDGTFENDVLGRCWSIFGLNGARLAVCSPRLWRRSPTNTLIARE